MSRPLAIAPGKSQTGRVILASGSRARRDMLKAAGIDFVVETADVDEEALRQSLPSQREGVMTAPAEMALMLAGAKALAVSRRHPGDIVIGGDQVLAVGNRIFSKPSNLTDARAQLIKLRGRDHILVSAAAIGRGDSLVWSHAEEARMRMRDFSDGFVDSYLAAVGDEVQSSVGAYHVEGPGIQLFEAIDGDYFTILGMPLLPLLAKLRGLGVLQH